MQKQTKSQYPGFLISRERMLTKNVEMQLTPDGDILFIDRSDWMFPLFTDEAVTNLMQQFGEDRTDSMLDQAANIVRAEMMAEKIRQCIID